MARTVSGLIYIVAADLLKRDKKSFFLVLSRFAPPADTEQLEGVSAALAMGKEVGVGEMTFHDPGSDDFGQAEGSSRPVLFVGLETLALRLDGWIGRRSGDGGSLVKVASVASALDLLGERDFEAILVDGRLGETPLLQLLRHLQAWNDPTPVVLLAGPEELDLAARGLREGACDLLLRGSLDGDSLARSLRYATGVRRAAVRAKEMEGLNRELRLLLASVLAMSEDALLAVRGGDLRVVYASGAAARLFGQRSDALVHQQLEALIGGESADGFAGVERLLRSGEPTAGYRVRLRGPGGGVAATLSTRPVYGGSALEPDMVAVRLQPEASIPARRGAPVELQDACGDGLLDSLAMILSYSGALLLSLPATDRRREMVQGVRNAAERGLALTRVLRGAISTGDG
jgi:PAS domain-containing protein